MIELEVCMATQSWVNREYRRGLRTHPCGAPVLRISGTDFVLLAGINDENELIDGGKKGAIDYLAPGELETFIAKLSIRSYKEQIQQILQDEPTEEEKAESSQKESKQADAKKVKSDEQKPKPEHKGKDLPGTSTVETKKNKETAKTSVPATAKKAKLNANAFEFQLRQLLLIKPGGKWFDLEYTAEGTSDPQDESLVSQYKALAIKLFEAETGLYKSKKNMQKGANSAWMKNNRKLKTFAQHPFDKLEQKASGNKGAHDRRLILWYFEHLLKHHVAEFVVALDELAHDTVASTKAKSLSTAHKLLLNRPEQERALLIQVVNKLGDPEYKTAAKASYLLETLLNKHPNMKAVVCSEVERLMFRPNINLKAQYYAEGPVVCFLNQVLLSHDELASKLISICFSFFRACIKKKDVESKMLSALLSGVNRAYPYAKAGDEKVNSWTRCLK
uniref:CCAAT-binding factor domain-containing protein n=1 Tax=Salmo trutta TaxID=8032 RepID=A0A674C2H3_SALTR